MFYSYKGLYPQPIGHEIILDDGTIKEGRHGFTHEDLTNAGYVKVDAKPQYNRFTEKVTWDRENFDWIVEPMTEDEKKQWLGRLTSEWRKVRMKRNDLLKETDVESLRQMEVQGFVSVELKEYRQALRDIPQNFTDPLRIVWPSKPENL